MSGPVASKGGGDELDFLDCWSCGGGRFGLLPNQGGYEVSGSDIFSLLIGGALGYYVVAHMLRTGKPA
jgi:hypothetical protein